MAHIHCAASGFIHLPVQFLRYLDLRQICNAIATVTDEVNMGFNRTIKPFHTVHCTQTNDFALCLEHAQVSIHCTQRQIGDLLLQVVEYHLCGRMLIGLQRWYSTT